MDVSWQEHLQDISVEDTLEIDLDDVNPTMDEENTLQYLCEEPHIYLHVVSCFLAPQTTNLIGYIKHIKVNVLINSDNTHNFIHWRMVEETHCDVYPITNFQIMITNGGMMKCGGWLENVKLYVKLQMG